MTRINMASTRSSPFHMAIFGLVIFAALVPQAAATDMEPDFMQPTEDPWEDATCQTFQESGNNPGFTIQDGGPLPVLPTLSLDGTALEITMVDECLHFKNDGDRVLSARTRMYKYTDPNNPNNEIVAPYGPVIK